MQEKELAQAAIDARETAYVPYSGFAVGAALLTKSGKIYKGCNIENAAYGPSNCAERTAFFKAVSEGEREFAAIAIVGGRQGEPIGDYCPPCGVCRQVMMEFCDPQTFRIILPKSAQEWKTYSLGELLPLGFSGKDLEK
jgi:cytidine deaminase